MSGADPIGDAPVDTAEGVEDTETRNRLVELGVDQLQGFVIAHPTPANLDENPR